MFDNRHFSRIKGWRAVTEEAVSGKVLEDPQANLTSRRE